MKSSFLNAFIRAIVVDLLLWVYVRVRVTIGIRVGICVGVGICITEPQGLGLFHAVSLASRR